MLLTRHTGACIYLSMGRHSANSTAEPDSKRSQAVGSEGSKLLLNGHEVSVMQDAYHTVD